MEEKLFFYRTVCRVGELHLADQTSGRKPQRAFAEGCSRLFEVSFKITGQFLGQIICCTCRTPVPQALLQEQTLMPLNSGNSEVLPVPGRH